MAWTNLTLTVDGRNALNQAQFDNQLNFKSIVVGDGTAPANFRTQKKLVHQLYELTDLKIDKTDSGCTLTADFPRVDYDYYFREVGIIVTTKEGDKLYVYDNCGEDAQYIVSSTGAETTQKRLRLALVISDVENITISEPSILYVAYDDYEQTILELNQTKVDKVEGKGLSTNDYTNADKNKLSGIEDGAEVNVQSDWNVLDSNSDAYIKNKPQSMKNPTSLNISLNGISQGVYDGSSQKNVNITAENVGADSSGTAETKVSEHNSSEEAHADIRNLITTLTNTIDGKVNKAGDTMTGTLYTKNLLVSSSAKGGGTDGYIHFVRIEITGQYADRVIAFKIGGRQRGVTNISIKFSGDTANPQLYKCWINGDCSYKIYIVKSNEDIPTWDLYAQKFMGWGEVSVLSSHYTGSVKVTYPGTFIAEKGEDWIEATIETVGNAFNSDTVDGKHASDFVSKSGDIMTGDLVIPIGRANANMSVPCAGRIDSTTLIPQGLSECKTFLGSIVDENSTFWNIISIRHGNGYNDGRYFGIYIRSLLLGEGSHGGSLLWNKQMGSNKGWLGERVLLDSQNYKDFCTPANMGLENVNNTPDYLKSVQSATYLSGWGDTRNIETKPSDYSEKFKPVGLKTPTASKITTGSSFATLVGIRGWSDASAGKAHELAFDGNGKLLHRAGLTSWEGWREIAHIDDLTSKNIGALSLDGGDMNENATIYMTGIDTSIVLSANNGTSCITNNIVSVENNVCRLSLLSKIGTSNKCGMEALTKSNSRTGKLYFYDGNFELESYNTFTINVTEDPDVAKFYYFDKYGLYPIMENVDIGRSSFKWRNIYAVNGTIQTSDRTKKTNINSLEIQKIQAFIYGLNPVSYKMIDGTSGRTHYGFIAQDIEELMKKLDMDSSDFAGFIKSPKKIIKYEDENGIKLENPIEEVIENEYDYALRYDEFIAPLIKVVQEQQKTIEQQQRMIEQQQKEIEQIKKDISKIYSSI